MNQTDWKIKWDDSFNMGIPVVDEEHQRFISRVNDLDAAIAKHKDRREIERLIHVIIHEARSHFDDEERQLAERGYPDAGLHVAKHARLRSLLWNVLRMSYATEPGADWVKKGLLVTQMLLEHFQLDDTRYRDFLRQRPAAKQNA